jgi:hypothetical protein
MSARVQGLQALGATVARITGPIISRRGSAISAIASRWSEIVGDTLAAQTMPEKVSFPPRGVGAGTLRLRVNSGGLATEIQHMEPVLLQRINTFLGYRAVARLQLIHRPLPILPPAPQPTSRRLSAEEERQLTQAIAGVDDPSLREVLRAIGRSVIGESELARENAPKPADASAKQ